MTKRGIDVSKWQGVINWPEVSRQVGFAILKAGGSDDGLYQDPYFERNYSEATKAGVPVGAYYFVGPKCLTAEDGAADAERFIRMLQGKKFAYPVYMDFEAPAAGQRQACTNAAIEFCKVMEEHDFYVGVYASDISGFKDRLDLGRLAAFDIWVASYGASPSYIKSFRDTYGMWQYTDTGHIAGINGDVDMDIAFYDFPKIMERTGLNGF